MCTQNIYTQVKCMCTHTHTHTHTQGCPCNIEDVYPRGGDEAGGYPVKITLSGFDISQTSFSIKCMFGDVAVDATSPSPGAYFLVYAPSVFSRRYVAVSMCVFSRICTFCLQ
jgi:hypothetical protein